MSNQEWRVIVKRTNDHLKWQKTPNKEDGLEAIESLDSSRESGQSVEKPTKWPTRINSSGSVVGPVGSSSASVVGPVGTSSIIEPGVLNVSGSSNYISSLLRHDSCGGRACEAVVSGAGSSSSLSESRRDDKDYSESRRDDKDYSESRRDDKNYVSTTKFFPRYLENPLNTNYLRPTRGDPGLNSFKRRFSHDEREVHKAALNRARKQALTELQLPKEWIENKLEDLMYKIDPRTQTPASGFFESFQRLRKFNHELQTNTNTNTQTELADILMIDNHEFSREHFYLNNYFQIALVDYYWNLLKTEQTYHSVKVIYHQKKPHLKIGFQDSRK